ncbi:GyrI-like domain-containing protein [Winogradskyella forsetii]|uniref:GyrI-like domain-containing protein n=1 Tax=Winogradskyella forsetii TaxID=2686077 RepID=UPI0015B95D15|nr:GyrI-like domain-containing protein [Winogradskyella forsetii]
MHAEIKHCPERKVVGLSATMKQKEHHKIAELWKRFMPRKREIGNLVSEELIAMQIFPEDKTAEVNNEYNIWACAEVSNFETIPKGLEVFSIPQGKYAVFLHKGMDASATYQKIMTEWLPTSDFKIDNRPHFQVMGAKYRNGSADSEEEFYVPVKLKT